MNVKFFYTFVLEYGVLAIYNMDIKDKKTEKQDGK